MIVLSVMATETLESHSIIARWSEPDDHDHCQRRSLVHAQHECLLARALLRALLHVSAGSVKYFFRYDGRGKLFVEDNCGHTGPNVSLSHTRGMVFAGVSSLGPLGVDVEAHRPRAFAQLAEFGFGQAERSRVREYGASEFYRIWTLREAAAKAIGDGLTLAMDGEDRVADGPADGVWRRRFGLQDWVLGSFHPASGISAAAACVLHGEAASTITMTWVDVSQSI